jgi:hypothetical protein
MPELVWVATRPQKIIIAAIMKTQPAAPMSLSYQPIIVNDSSACLEPPP